MFERHGQIDGGVGRFESVASYVGVLRPSVWGRAGKWRISLFVRLAAVLGVIVVSALTATFFLTSVRLRIDLEHAARVRFARARRAAEALLQEFVGELRLRYEAAARAPDLRAALARRDHVTAERWAWSLVRDFDAVAVLIDDMEGVPLALVAEGESLTGIQGGRKALGVDDGFGRCVVVGPGSKILRAVTGVQPHGWRVVEIQGALFVVVTLPVQDEAKAVGRLSVLESLDDERLARWSMLCGARLAATCRAQPEQDVLSSSLPKVKALTVCTSVAPERRALRRMQRHVWGATVIALVLSLSMGVLFSRRFSALVSSIARTAERIGEGMWSARTRLRRNDEIGDLAAAIDRMGERLGETYRELLRADKVAVLGRLAGGVVHDVNNVLMIVLGSCDLLAEELGPEHPAHALLEDVRSSSERAIRLMRQILTFGRQNEQARALPLVVDAAIKKAHRLLSLTLGRGVHFELELGAKGATVQIDQNLFEQILLNFAVNARDAFGARGGRFRLATRCVYLETSLPEVQPALTPGRYVCLQVEDDGEGMDEVTRLRAFEPFFTTKPEGKGTGLGLATVFEIVRAAGGGIRLETERGKGTRFEVFLPCEGATSAEHVRSVGDGSCRNPNSAVHLR